MNAALASWRRRWARRPATVEAIPTALPLADEVDDGEQTDPHDVDEVPVVGHDDRSRRLARSEGAERAADEKEDEGDQAAEHVQAVEARRYVVDGAVAVTRQREVIVHEVLERLAADEDRAHEEREDVPEPEARHLTALSGEDAELARDRRQDQNDRERRGGLEVENHALGRPDR